MRGAADFGSGARVREIGVCDLVRRRQLGTGVSPSGQQPLVVHRPPVPSLFPRSSVVERLTLDQKAAGSSPAEGVSIPPRTCEAFLIRKIGLSG